MRRPLQSAALAISVGPCQISVQGGWPRNWGCGASRHRLCSSLALHGRGCGEGGRLRGCEGPADVVNQVGAPGACR
eukprot:9790589-Alexandrium_andersonii.AAC.1